MGQLSDLIAQAKANEIEQAQNALAQQLDTIAGAREFAEKYFGPLTDPEHKRRAASRLEPFTLWCAAKGVPALPARSTTVAAWIISETDRGVDEKQIRGTLSEIELAHEVLGLNPVATFWVRFALSKMSGAIEAPRSWNKSEKAMFTGLPFEAQQVIARREQDRETTLRRAQNEAAELRRLKVEAEIKSADNTEKGIDSNA